MKYGETVYGRHTATSPAAVKSLKSNKIYNGRVTLTLRTQKTLHVVKKSYSIEQSTQVNGVLRFLYLKVSQTLSLQNHTLRSSWDPGTFRVCKHLNHVPLASREWH